MITFRILLLSLIIGFNAMVSVQSHAQVSERLHFERYRVENGLASNFVRDITQDRDGYIWISTETGLTRYDGYEFKIFRHMRTDSTSISSDNLSRMITDQNGVLWIAAENALNRYDADANRFFRYKHDPNDSTTLPSGVISSLYQTRNGKMWVGMDTGELASLDIQTGIFTHYPFDRSRYMQNVPGLNRATRLAEDSDGRLYVGVTGGGIHVLDSETGRSLDHWIHDPSNPASIPNNLITSLFVDRDDVLWVGYRTGMTTALIAPPTDGESGLFNRVLQTGETRVYTYHPVHQPSWWFNVSDITQSKDGTIWVTDTGNNELTMYLADSDSFHRYSYKADDPHSLPWVFATAVYEDVDGILWVGTSRGLAKSDRERFQLEAITLNPGDPFHLDNLHYGIFEVRDNVFWLFYVRFRNAVEWNRNTNEIKTLPFTGSAQMPDGSSATSGLRPGIFDGKQTIWFNSESNVFSSLDVVTLKTTNLFPLSENFTTTTLLAMEWMPDSTLWISTIEGVLEFNPSTGKATPVELNARLNKMSIGPSGTIWALDSAGLLDSTSSARGNLLGRIDAATKRFNPVDINQDYLDIISSGAIYSLLETRDGAVWLGKTDGLVRYDPATGRFTLFDQSKGLAYFNVNELIEDEAGFVWMTTEHGISRFDPRTERFRHFEKEDGLRPFRMNRGSAFLRKNGEILFGGAGGINMFHPASIRDFTTPPRILITNVNVAGKPRAMGGGIAIDWDNNEFDIEYTSVNFRNTKSTTYSYMLEGYHNDWVDAGSRRIIQFTNLPPGPYTLLVKAMNAEGLESEVPAQLFIRILPPWWRTWWAYGFYVMMFAGMVFGVDRTQRRRLLRKEREEAREKELAQAKEIEKAYRNLEVAHKNLEAAQHQLVQQEKLASLGQLTAGIAHEIKNPLNFVNNFSDVSLEMIDEALEELGKSTQDVHKAETVTILMDIKTNLAKIHEHGSRADGIVQSMLMHSRGGSGKMEPTDLNAVVKEYVNLAFHGMRAGKDPINVDIDLQLSEKVGDVPLIAEDFSRVILNLTNNAFDAMRESEAVHKRDVRSEVPGVVMAKPSAMQDSGHRSERSDGHDSSGAQGSQAYKPKLIVRTKSENGQITIEIEDNGPGIPDDIKDKILQPFFTTKKGTQGTGLGLSITHDIIKAHGGSLGINSHPGQTTFTIHLEKMI
jgi:signal transduction histidine kinase/ligand-binding sensor domain-containing protein